MKLDFCALIVLACLLASGCGPGDPEGPICDPLGSNSPSDVGTSDPTQGLKATLYSIPANFNHTPITVTDAQSSGIRFDLDVYLSQLNVPTQRFEEGFVASNGMPLTNPDGSLFTAWFSFHVETFLTLSAKQLPGQYQLALYSDDGSVLKADTGTGYQTIVDNDLEHESELRVARTPVTFNAVGDRLPITVDYMQGSPDYLALVMLWRPWPTSEDTPVIDPADGVIAPSDFWDTTQTPSVARQPWLDLLSRGWKVVAPENFQLSGINPCASQPK